MVRQQPLTLAAPDSNTLTLRQAVIENVRPQIEAGRYAARAIPGEPFVVEADVFAEYQLILAAAVLYRREDDEDWSEVRMHEVAEDHFRGDFSPEDLGRYRYTVEAWIDRFRTWRRDLARWHEAGHDISADLQIGAKLVADAAARATADGSDSLQKYAFRLASTRDTAEAAKVALSDELADLMARYPDRSAATHYQRELPLIVDPPKAVFSTWYEMFPRSAAPEPGRHGTFADVEARLPYVAEMGFDVLYLPPIHPIGRTNRKGRNNALNAGSSDPGSPWAIGSDEGGHKSIHAELGTLEDFHRLVSRALAFGIDIALDLAYQCSPDHPYIREHPEWFRQRPDGSIQYAENPPKKYQDIYPFNFETEDREALWEELKSIVLYWIEQGVHIFRVDNPHTKPFPFWEWLIRGVTQEYPDVIFLSEAFTRAALQRSLAKLGFNQSYTQFAWRNTKQELTDYFSEVTRSEMRYYFNPNAWPNTPDILTGYVQRGGLPAFVSRYILAATLSASCGIYGPPFELCETTPIRPGDEEDYLNSDKYQINRWDIERTDGLRPLITRINQIRRDNPALQNNHSLRFHPIDNDQLICFSKAAALNTIVIVVNLDPFQPQVGVADLPIDEWGIDAHSSYEVQELLNGATYRWKGPRNQVVLDPASTPALILRLNTGAQS